MVGSALEGVGAVILIKTNSPLAYYGGGGGGENSNYGGDRYSDKIDGTGGGACRKQSELYSGSR